MMGLPHLCQFSPEYITIRKLGAIILNHNRDVFAFKIALTYHMNPPLYVPWYVHSAVNTMLNACGYNMVERLLKKKHLPSGKLT